MPSLNLPERLKQEPFNGDYIKIMGLEQKESYNQQEIENAFRQQALKFHPDSVRNNRPGVIPSNEDEANECFKALNEIKNILLSSAQLQTT